MTELKKHLNGMTPPRQPPQASTADQQDGATGGRPRTKPLNVINTILGECMCVPFPLAGRGNNNNNSSGHHSSYFNPNTQFLELHGVEYIGLGAVMDELSASERVKDTVQALLERPSRSISIGYLVLDAPNDGSDGLLQQKSSNTTTKRITETIPLATWIKNYPNDRNMARPLQQTIDNISAKKFGTAIEQLEKELKHQYSHLRNHNNKFLCGITAHNIAVLYVLKGEQEQNDADSQKAMEVFRQAVTLKKAAFGERHPQVAVSLDEIGIQLFARERYEDALNAFHESKKIRIDIFGSMHPKVAMVSNNIACCNFQLRNHVAALATFKEAREILKQGGKSGTSQMGSSDLDLLHVAIVLCNIGYMQIRLKAYEDAQSIFEEALLIQQSVLGDDCNNHPAIKDTRSNMEFTNAFHS